MAESPNPLCSMRGYKKEDGGCHFEPRYERLGPAPEVLNCFVSFDNNYLNDEDLSALDRVSRNKYICDVCVRCGATTII